MIIRERKNDYCIVHGVIHTDARLYEICDYCLQHKRWMYPRAIYYRYGFATKDVLMCDDCHKIERKFYESRLTTHVTEHNAYEVICLTIMKNHQIPFYFRKIIIIPLSTIKKLIMELS